MAQIHCGEESRKALTHTVSSLVGRVSLTIAEIGMEIEKPAIPSEAGLEI
jgi:hypothetical protein